MIKRGMRGNKRRKPRKESGGGGGIFRGFGKNRVPRRLLRMDHLPLLAASESLRITSSRLKVAGAFALGSLLPGKFALAVPLLERGTRWWGNEREKSLVPSSVSGELIDVRFAPHHRHMVMVLDHEKLERTLAELEFPDHAIRSIERGRPHRMLQFHDESLRRLTGELATVIDATADGNHSFDAEQLDLFLLESALAILDQEPATTLERGGDRRLIQRAIQVHDELAIFPNVMALCTELKACPRTLQAAF